MHSLLLPGVDFYQVVFTLPDNLSSLALGNRREMFRLLFHAVVPCGGPSLKHPEQWKTTVPPAHERQNRCWLVDADELRRRFRDCFLSGLRTLHANDRLKLYGDWSHLRDGDRFEEFLAPLEAKSWVTYIEPPPQGSRAEDVVKYLARYLTGGPISDRRLVDYDGRNVTFTARVGKTHGGSDETEDVTVSALEFVRRWCLHILPSGFTKSRRFGGWSSRHRDRYLATCKTLLCLDANDDAMNDERRDESDRGSETVSSSEPTASSEITASKRRPCPVCGEDLERLEFVHRISWRDIFSSNDCPTWYRVREPSG